MDFGLRDSWRRCVLSVTLVLVAVGACPRWSLAATSEETATVKQLVADALRAEIVGDDTRRTALLDQAIQAAPEYSPARWQSGQIEAGGKWLPLQDAQRVVAADPRQALYVQRRAAAGDNPDAQLALARWCRKNGLDDEAKFHWATVLANQPANEDAQRALGVRPYRGRLMSNHDIEQAHREIKDARQAVKEYAPRIAQWQRLLSSGDLASRNEALSEVRSLDDPRAIPALEDLTLDQRLSSNSQFERCLQWSEAFLEALDKMPGQASTKSLVRHAVFSPLKSIRESATASLKKRPPQDFVPLLLAELNMPVESSFRVVTDDDGSVHYWHSFYREGRNADWSFEGRFSAMQEDLQGPTDVTVTDRRGNEPKVTEFRATAGTDPAVRAQMMNVAARNQQTLAGRAVASETSVARVNGAIESRNSLVIPVLAATTGQQFGDNPRGWWDWWDNYNEYSTGYERPVREQRYADSSHTYYRQPGRESYSIDPPARPMHSCFAKGTAVWTKTGQRPIDTLEVGDLVLAQNVETGELAYKAIVGRTIRPPSPTVNLKYDGETLRATPSHPMWVDGAGWRMVKELGDGAILHGVKGPIQVATIEPAEDTEAYNLIVADFSSYFVSEHGVLVHDNTPRQPTSATVPGLIEK